MQPEGRNKPTTGVHVPTPHAVLLCLQQAFTTCTLKDLCPEDKQKVAQLVKQVRQEAPRASALLPVLCCLHLGRVAPVTATGGGARQGEPAAEGSSVNGGCPMHLYLVCVPSVASTNSSRTCTPLQEATAAEEKLRQIQECNKEAVKENCR